MIVEKAAEIYTEELTEVLEDFDWYDPEKMGITTEEKENILFRCRSLISDINQDLKNTKNQIGELNALLNEVREHLYKVG